MTLFVFTMPSLQGILCRVTQLPDCRLDAFSQLQIEPNRLNAVFVRIHGLPPGSPTFCPHPLMGFKDFWCARTILSGIEVMHMTRKGQMKDDGVMRTVPIQFYSLMT